MDAPLVSVKCLVYNHEPYLRQCLEGFVKQKTNFPFEVIVHDDFSSDGSVSIIKDYAEKYPKIIKPLYESENQYSKHDGSLRRIVNNAIHKDAKYLAICEGDDCWIDSCKLQKQVDFLESHPEFGMIHTNFNVIDEHSNSEFKRSIDYSKVRNVEDSILLGRYGIGTLTTLIRKEIYDSLPLHYMKEKPLMGDLPMWIEISHVSKIMYINDVTASYRLLSNSASHSSDIDKRIAFIRNAYDCRRYYAKLFLKDHLLDEIGKKCDIEIFKVKVKEGKRVKDAFSAFCKLAKKYGIFKLPLVLYIYIAFYMFPLSKKMLLGIKK